MTRRARTATWGLLLALSMTLGGCLEGGGGDPTPAGPEEQWIFGGSWTPEYTQADIDAWCEVAKAYDNECIVMESFPPQYALRFESEATCKEARVKVLALPHITARECSRIEPSDDPDQPVSSNASGSPGSSSGAWSFHGAFLPGYSAADIDAWCSLARELGQTCALMKSEPPQFQWSFASARACEDARVRAEGLGTVRVDPCASRET